MINKKLCSRCKQEKPVKAFSPNKWNKTGFQSACKECRRGDYRGRYKENLRKKWAEDPEHRNKAKKRMRLWWVRNREDVLEHWRNERKKNRKIVIKMYGSECECCKESKEEFLAVDHVNGDGEKERRKLHGSDGVYKKAC